MTLPYEMDGERISLPVEVKNDKWLTFEASAVRKERSGIHALLRVVDDKDLTLMRSVINVDDGEKMRWFAARAHENLNGLKADYTKTALYQDLDIFASGLWDYKLAIDAPEEISGEEEPVPPAFILEPYVIKEGGTILYAPPGRGKSYVSLVMAISIDAGLQTFWPCKQAKVLMVNLERSKQSYKNRIGLVNRVLGLPPTRPLYVLNARGKSLADVMPLIAKAVATEGVELVVLDSISRAGMGSLVEDQTANRIVDQLNSITAAWLAIGHTPRADEGHVFGSIFFDAAADICVQLFTQEPDFNSLKMGVALSITKQNDLGPRPREMFAMDFDQYGMKVFRRAISGEFQGIEKNSWSRLVGQIRSYLLDVGKATATQIAQAISAGEVLTNNQLANKRAEISRELNDPKNSQVFVKLPKEGNEQPFGVRLVWGKEAETEDPAEF